MEIGAQFYTLRDNCSCLEDFEKSLERVAKIGYKTVQISGTCGYDPHWLKETLDKYGLRCVLTHTSPDRIINEPLAVVEEHKIFGCTNIGIGIMPGGPTKENLELFIKNFKEPARIFRENGAKLFYHHHGHEFERLPDGSTFMDKILEAFPPEELGITVDTYWAQFAGTNPAVMIDSLAAKGRIELVHYKDMTMALDPNGGSPYASVQAMAPVGEGNIDWVSVDKAVENAGIKYCFVGKAEFQPFFIVFYNKNYYNKYDID